MTLTDHERRWSDDRAIEVYERVFFVDPIDGDSPHRHVIAEQMRQVKEAETIEDGMAVIRGWFLDRMDLDYSLRKSVVRIRRFK